MHMCYFSLYRLVKLKLFYSVTELREKTAKHDASRQNP
jgi:hypothetical protein